MPAQLEGMEQLLRQLGQIGRTLESGTKERALEAGGEFMKVKVRSYAREKSGNLKENVIVSNVENDQIAIGPDQQGDAFYGHILEFGRKAGTARIKRNDKRVDYPYPGMNPKPFLGPAFENHKDEAQEVMKDVIREDLGL
ncbi:HK97-gp10 family putative phage morphogenesis protein [Cytobacillus firmus]|uniref:HK97-gp10 family putative phage morphogenesis protein n=1 Tax=Cytobacillus firmus TaxID=1399 RepID=UPI0036A7B288